MGCGDVKFHRDKGSRHGRVGITEHDDQVGFLLHQYLLEPDEDLPCHLSVGSGPDPEIMIRIGNFELVKEDLGEVLIVMLTCVNDDLLMFLPDLPGEREELDELRAGSDDGCDFHFVSPAKLISL